MTTTNVVPYRGRSFGQQASSEISDASGDQRITQFQDPRLVSAMLDAVSRWREWCHRRIDRFEPTQGNRGRLKHSLDMTLPPDPALAYDFAERSATRATDVIGAVIAPIAIVVKGPLHEFDVDAAGVGSVPTLTRGQNEELMAAMLIKAYSDALRLPTLPERLSEALAYIVGPGHDALVVAEILITHGFFGPDELFDPGQLPLPVAELTRDLASGFLLCLLIPSTALGSRTLVKISYLWSMDRLRRVTASQLLSSMHQFQLPMTAPSDAGSYHLELVVPDGVRCSAVELPASRHRVLRRSFVGFRDTAVHVHNAYDEPPRVDARVELTSLRSPAHYQAIGALFVTFLVAWGLVYFADAERVASSSANGLSLLLSLPALYFGLSAARHGSSLADALNRPFRWLLLVSGILLFLFAGAPVVIDSAGALHVAWLGIAYVATLVFAGAGLQGIWAQARLWWRFDEYARFRLDNPDIPA